MYRKWAGGHLGKEPLQANGGAGAKVLRSEQLLPWTHREQGSEDEQATLVRRRNKVREVMRQGPVAAGRDGRSTSYRFHR